MPTYQIPDKDVLTSFVGKVGKGGSKGKGQSNAKGMPMWAGKKKSGGDKQQKRMRQRGERQSKIRT